MAAAKKSKIGRPAKQRLPRLSEFSSDETTATSTKVTPGDKACDAVADFTGIPVNIVRRVLVDGDVPSPALAKRFADALHADDRHLVKRKRVTPGVEFSHPAQRFGLPPDGYVGPVVIPVSKVEPGMLLMTSDVSHARQGWLLVTGAPNRDEEDRYSLKIQTEHGIVRSAHHMSIRVAVQADSDSR